MLNNTGAMVITPWLNPHQGFRLFLRGVAFLPAETRSRGWI